MFSFFTSRATCKITEFLDYINATLVNFDEVSYYLLYGRFARSEELRHYSDSLVKERNLDEYIKSYIDALIQKQSLVATIRSAISALDQSEDSWPVQTVNVVQLIAKVPSIVAYAYRRKNGLEPIEADQQLSHAANFLYMLFGEEKTAAEVDALETYMILTAEHGMNASTFASRVVMSTGSDVFSAVTAAIGALKGPLHGGAPAGVLEYLADVDQSAVKEVIERKLNDHEKIMGFGHRVYKTEDPRAAALKQKLISLNPRPDWVENTLKIEQETVHYLNQVKPGRNLYANVEYYAAAIMKAIGIPNELFTPIFCSSRIVGWLAHCKEQSEDNVIFRPNAKYIG